MRLSFVLLLATFAAPLAAQAQGVTLSLGSDSGSFGQTVTIPISIATEGTLPSAVVFRVTYDALVLSYLGYIEGPIIPADKSVTVAVEPRGIIILVSGSDSVLVDGTLVSLKFNVTGVTPGTTVLGGVNASASTAQAMDLPVTIQNGSVVVGSGSGGFGCSGTKESGLATSSVFLPAFLPMSGTVEGLPVLEGGEPVSIRVRSEESVLPDAISATIAGTMEQSASVKWVALREDSREGWVVLLPATSWTPGYLDVVVAAGGTSVSQRFQVLESEVVAPGDVSVEPVSVDAALPDSPGPAWAITPGTPFESPQTLSIPLPDGLNPNEFDVMLYDGNLTWYDANDVSGWLVDEPVVEQKSGHAFVKLTVAYGAIVAFTPKPTTDVAEAAMPPTVVGAALLVLLFVTGGRRNRRRYDGAAVRK